MSARLIAIPISHYCERTRWALEHAGVVAALIERPRAHRAGAHALRVYAEHR